MFPLFDQLNRSDLSQQFVDFLEQPFDPNGFLQLGQVDEIGESLQLILGPPMGDQIRIRLDFTIFRKIVFYKYTSREINILFVAGSKHKYSDIQE